MKCVCGGNGIVRSNQLWLCLCERDTQVFGVASNNSQPASSELPIREFEKCVAGGDISVSSSLTTHTHSKY